MESDEKDRSATSPFATNLFEAAGIAEESDEDAEFLTPKLNSIVVPTKQIDVQEDKSDDSCGFAISPQLINPKIASYRLPR